ncbi:hypothetical protein BHE74_00012086 [Ensete ventricosum]|nr:hypothetical protein GW17_00055356 [Ensete ventricosum]RWW79614.1 hypothetical protein BHE74_00012086 [Ensete ventricosum]RZR77926.1 hypothetical protein BHM03_00003134 [Ensete ventricosum]
MLLDHSQQLSLAAQTSSDPSLHLSSSQPQQSFAANCLDRGQHRSEHDQQRSLTPYRRCPPLKQPCTPLPRLHPIAATPLLQPTPPAATKSHRSRRHCYPLLPPPSLLPPDSDTSAAIFEQISAT